MNRDFRVVALVAASLGLIVSLFFALRPDGDDQPVAATTTQQVTTAAATTEQPTSTAPETTDTETTAPRVTTAAPEPEAPVTIRISVAADRAPTVRKFSVRRGREVALVVTSELTDHVHLHGYDLMADVGPGAPATIEFTADAAGRFEIELEDRALEIGDLEVRP